MTDMCEHHPTYDDFLTGEFQRGYYEDWEDLCQRIEKLNELEERFERQFPNIIDCLENYNELDLLPEDEIQKILQPDNEE